MKFCGWEQDVWKDLVTAQEADGPKDVLLTATIESGAQVESAGGVDNIAGVERITGGNWDPQVTSKGTGGVSHAAVERHAVGSSEFS